MKKPSFILFLLALSITAFAQADLEKAKNSFNKVLALAPKHSSAFYRLGVIAMAQSDVGEAHKIGKNLEAIDPDFAEDYNIDLGLIPKPAP